MPNQTRTHRLHDVEVKQVNFSGNWYTTVDGRIAIANLVAIEQIRTQPSYSVLEHSIIPVADRWAYTCTIEYPHGSGHYYPGSDFIDTAAKDGLAKAETSAIGRALGLAGILDEQGVASADEMEHAEPEQREPRPLPMRKPKTLKELWSGLRLRVGQRGLIENELQWEDTLCEVTGKNITDTAKLTKADYDAVVAYFTRLAAEQDEQQLQARLEDTTWKGGA